MIKDLLYGLLEKNPQERIGSRFGAIEIKKHPWLKAINWDKVLNRKLVNKKINIEKIDFNNLKEVPNFEVSSNNKWNSFSGWSFIEDSY